MTTPVASFDSKHEDMIHDCQYDYYAKKLATCSSDGKIKIFEVAGDSYNPNPIFTITGHKGPVWQLAWAHPKFGSLLASCSYDGRVLIHREAPQNNWTTIHEHSGHDCSVNSICWASHEYGLVLACASSDGKISILEHKNGAWITTDIENDSLGCNSVSWAPYSSSNSQAEDGSLIWRLVTGACDNSVRVWKRQDVGSTSGLWTEELGQSVKQPHTDWVRDVAWAPSSALAYSVFASASEDKSVYIWTQVHGTNSWEMKLLKTFEAPVWRVSWSITGNVLAVSTGDHKVSLWKQSVDESWGQISSVEESE